MGSYIDSLREAARRMLRSQGGMLYINRSNSEGVSELMLRISDMVPSKLEFPEVIYTDSDEIVFESLENNFSISESRISLDYCWVKSVMSESGEPWYDFSTMVVELATAGYPGCIGCGGPGSEEYWDEATMRIY
ncbi:MAG TPA: hypothetical protein HA315_02190 [Candidatus Thalassarchaeaceae archaeon]|jgi:hypothetical protein|nr:hypothetical protein [Euryarchaeota archaeon]DAC44227.1 MAG TPA: hypothetical protein D7H72_02185 [Candidatus Poseidoniales archaeon]HII34791.1 hypothetical protein [Candidatus Thalassarchaeaceae archaeon]|tara:strand:- start:69858 stop:70259 length:402 start_codon:yes stop_codon:yes gene_type:complete